MNKLDELQKLCDEATPGPWTHDDGQVGACSDTADLKYHKEINPVDSKYDRLSICWNSYPAQYGCECGKYNSDNDGEFIAAARTYMPLLIAVARASESNPCRHYAEQDGCTVCEALAALEQAK